MDEVVAFASVFLLNSLQVIMLIVITWKLVVTRRKNYNTKKLELMEKILKLI